MSEFWTPEPDPEPARVTVGGVEPGLDDATLTELMGPKCPECGWRGGQHRVPVMDVPACSSWDPVVQPKRVRQEG